MARRASFVVHLADDTCAGAGIESRAGPWGGEPIKGSQEGEPHVPKRLLIATLLAAVLVGCGQGPAPTSQPASSAAGDVAVAILDPVSRAERRARGHAHPNPSRNTHADPDAVTDANAGTVAVLHVEEAEVLDEVPARLGRHPRNARLCRQLRRPGSTFVFVDRDVVDRRLRLGRRANGEGGDCLLQESLRREGAVQQEGQGRGLERSADQDGRARTMAWRPITSCCSWPKVEWDTASTGDPTDGDRDADKALFERIYKTFKPKS